MTGNWELSQNQRVACVPADEACKNDLLPRVQYEADRIWEDQEGGLLFEQFDCFVGEFDLCAVAEDSLIVEWWVEIDRSFRHVQHTLQKYIHAGRAAIVFKNHFSFLFQLELLLDKGAPRGGRHVDIVFFIGYVVRIFVDFNLQILVRCIYLGKLVVLFSGHVVPATNFGIVMIGVIILYALLTALAAPASAPRLRVITLLLLKHNKVFAANVDVSRFSLFRRFTVLLELDNVILIWFVFLEHNSFDYSVADLKYKLLR